MKSDLVKERVFTVFFMVAVTFVAILLVGIVDIVTAKSVERNRSLFLRQAVADAAGKADLGPAENLLSWYESNVSMVTNAAGDPAHFWIEDPEGGGEPRLVLVHTGSGLWGSITAYVGFDSDAETIRGVTFQDHVETPGLGARIDEAWFRSQFVGKSGPFTEMNPEPADKDNLSEADYAFDQITGATITSSSIRTIMNESLDKAKTLVRSR